MYAVGESALSFSINNLSDLDIVFSSVINPSRYVKTPNQNIRGISAIIPVSLFSKVIHEIDPDRDDLIPQTITTADAVPDIFPSGGSENNHLNVVNTVKEALKFLLVPPVKRNVLFTAPVAATLDKTFITSAIELSVDTKMIFPGHFKKMTEMGCLFSLSADPEIDGKTAADMVLNKEKGIKYYSDLSQVSMSFNTQTARAMGIQIPEKLLRKATAVY